MKFEFLPNEVLIECFEYFNPLEIFYTFDQLNYHFNKLIRSIPLHLDLQHVGKSTFDQFCKKIFSNSELKQNIHSLKLSNKDTRDQIKTFFLLDEFSQLQSLTLTEVKQDDVEILKIMSPSISQLYSSRVTQFKGSITVTLTKIRALSMTESFQKLKSIDQLWSITNITLSFCYLDDLCQLLRNVPMLTYLKCQTVSSYYKMCVLTGYSDDHQCIHLKQLIIMELKCCFVDFEVILKYTPNLKSLTVSTDNESDLIDARRWEHLITSLLPQLNLFKFKLGCSRSLDTLHRFEQFQNDFWQEQHHWYTEYDLRDDLAQIYTTPYILNTYILAADLIRYSNKLVNEFNTFENVTDLIIYDKEICSCYFSNVTSLSLFGETLNWNTNDNTLLIESLTMIINFSNLNHLNISDNDNKDVPLLLLEMLKKAPNLSSINIDSHTVESLFSNNDLHKYLNKMIRKLSISGDIESILSEPARIEVFHEMFSNIEELKWDVYGDGLSNLLNQFSKLSTIKECYFPSSQHFSSLMNDLTEELE